MASVNDTTLFCDPEDRLIDMKSIQQMLGFKSRTAVDDAERSRSIPPSLRIGGSRRWRLSAVRAAIDRLEAEAFARYADPLS